MMSLQSIFNHINSHEKGEIREKHKQLFKFIGTRVTNYIPY